METVHLFVEEAILDTHMQVQPNLILPNPEERPHRQQMTLIAKQILINSDDLWTTGNVIAAALQLQASLLVSLEAPSAPTPASLETSSRPDLPPTTRTRPCHLQNFRDMDSAAIELQNIKHHVEGGKVPINRLKQAAAITYVTAVISLSVSVAVVNVADRSNIFERLSDAAQTATLFLVSVFGLVKLTSEDQNAIRNTLLGRRILRKPDDFVKYAGVKNVEDLKMVMSRCTKGLEWLDAKECCYVRMGGGGNVPIAGGLTKEQLEDAGHAFAGNRIFMNGEEKGLLTERIEDGTCHIHRKDKKYLFGACVLGSMEFSPGDQFLGTHRSPLCTSEEHITFAGR